MPRRLLTISHSYVVALNRRLAHEMARQGSGDWSVTAVAPERYHGDLRSIAFERFDEEACDTVRLPVRFDRHPHVMSYRGLRAVLADDWDVVHCWEEPYVFAALQAARGVRPRTRFVVSTFQNIAKRYPWPFAAIERRVMTRADGWIAFGRTVHDVASRRALYRDRPSRIIPPGVDVDRFRPDLECGVAIRARLSWPSDAFVVGYLGRFVRGKGLHVLMDALRRMRSDWRALFVGGGPLESELRGFATECHGRVHVQTGIDHTHVPDWLNAMSVLAAPSRTSARWREQFGRMIVEAMACGVPVVASDSGEMPFVVGPAGVVVPEGDAAALAAALDRLAGDAASRGSLASCGLARARDTFAWPIVAAAHLRFFEEICR
jgi:glycosyltransferase involved in cell wall biosynthesis